MKQVTKHPIVLSTLMAAMLALGGCGDSSSSDKDSAQKESKAADVLAKGIENFTQGALLPFTVLDDTLNNGAKAAGKMQIRNGGFGSDAVAHPTVANQFYALTDRGPNATYTGILGDEEKKGKKFPVPTYVPRIGLFELQADGSIKKISDITLKDTSGKEISGLPNTKNLGGTGETPYDKDGNPILVDASKPFNADTNPTKTDPFGLDGEGLVALKDGGFWVSDEYGPHMVHFDASGKEIGRINAFSADTRNITVAGKQVTLPAEFANRRANRGMEGLAITPDEKTLVGIMQSTMDNPSKDVRKLTITRIVTVNLETGKVGQYLYKQEKAQNSNSGIVALSDTEFLVIERDGGFELKEAGAQKHIYKITLDGATDLESISSSGEVKQDPALGLTIGGKTLEEVVLADEGDWKTLSAAGITPVAKTLVLDAVKTFNYPHDKLEGMWVMGDGRLGLLNDDDFATWATKGVLEQKYLDNEQTKEDGNMLYIATDLSY